jgi:hypothetical protein
MHTIQNANFIIVINNSIFSYFAINYFFNVSSKDFFKIMLTCNAVMVNRLPNRINISNNNYD